MSYPSRSLHVLAAGALVALAACGGGDKDKAKMEASADSMLQVDTTTHTSTTTTGTAAGATAGAPQLNDAQIVAVVSAANGAEVAAGELAEKSAKAADVKAFAKQMVADHGAMQKQGDQMVKAKNMTPQTNPVADSITKSANDLKTQLAAAKGADFDRAYMDAQVTGHRNTLALLQSAATMAQDSSLKKMLTDAQPKVQAHLDKATSIQSKLGATTTASAAGGTGATKP